MKDEEMAEEIANKRCHEIMCYGHCSFNSPKHHRCGEWHREYNCALAGLKAGRPQYHDLQKNPNDLPEDTYDVLDQAGYKVHYNFFQNVWVNEKDEIDKNVIAWCEVPTFDKE